MVQKNEAVPTTPLKPQARKVELGDVVGRGVHVGLLHEGLSFLRQNHERSDTHLTSQPRDVPVKHSKSFFQAEDVLRSSGVLHPSTSTITNVPLLKKIHKEAFPDGAEEEQARMERGTTPGLPRKGIGFDGSLRRRGHRATKRGQEQNERQSASRCILARMHGKGPPHQNPSMSYDKHSKTCIVPTFEAAPADRSPARRLDAPPLQGEMGRVPWKKWTPPYRAHEPWKHPWQHPEEDEAAQRIHAQENAASAGGPLGGRANILPEKSRPASVQEEHRMGDTWFRDPNHRVRASYFDTPLWSRAKRGIETPSWMQPDVMAHTSTWAFPYKDQNPDASRRADRADVPNTSSTDSNIDPKVLRSLAKKELRHYLARARAWSTEPLSTCPRDDLRMLARQNMSKIREMKKDESFNICERFGKPSSVTDKYRMALRKNEFLALETLDPYLSRNLQSSDRGDRAGKGDVSNLIRDVEAAQNELEKSIQAVAIAKKKSEMARLRMALANGDPAAALSISRGGTGMSRRIPETPDVFRVNTADQDAEEDEGSSRLGSGLVTAAGRSKSGAGSRMSTGKGMYRTPRHTSGI